MLSHRKDHVSNSSADSTLCLENMDGAAWQFRLFLTTNCDLSYHVVAMRYYTKKKDT